MLQWVVTTYTGDVYCPRTEMFFGDDEEKARQFLDTVRKNHPNKSHTLTQKEWREKSKPVYTFPLRVSPYPAFISVRRHR